MRLLDRYLLRELLIPLGYCLGGFLIFWIAFELFSELDEFQRHHLQPLDVAQYFLVTMPELLGRVVPVALLLGMLYALTNHARHHELTAMRCAGLSLWRLAFSYFGVSLFCGASLFCLTEILLPDSADKAAQIMEKYQPQAADASERAWYRNLTFFSVVQGRTNVVGPFHFNLLTSEMAKPRVWWTAADGHRWEINAARGIYSNGHWNFYEVQASIYPPGELVPRRLQTNALALPELRDPPRRIRSEIKVSSLTNLQQARGLSLSLAEIIEYKRWHPEKRHDPQLNTKFHVRLAAPWTCLVVVLITMPFGAATGRRNVFVAVASSIFFCFAYFVVQRFGEAAGLSGRLAPWLAGWLPNLLFAGLGLLLSFRVR